jgi:phosphatidylserine/phosphatidylglycerophosphate/cardiolipin synthase-like enzyme
VQVSLRLATCLVLALGACTHRAAQGDDEPGDASTDAPGVGCEPTSPRAVPPETFAGPVGLQDRIVGFIDGARERLDIGMYLFTVRAIVDRVIAAHQRGVAVRVLLDPDHTGNTQARNQLVAAGVSVRNAPALYTFAHAKYMIADDAALIMSANFNVDAMASERNYGLVDRDPDDVADLAAIFEMDWAAGGGEPLRPADLDCTRLVVSPDNTKQRLIELVGSATSTLDVEAIYISEVTLRNAIGQAHQRGVAVRVILEATPDNTSTITYFTNVGVEVRQPAGFLNHAKLIIADGVAFVGSANFSQTAMTRNREIGALVFEPGPAQTIRTQFDADWN